VYTWKRRGRAGRGRGEKDNCGSENSWISGGLPSISRRRRRGEKKGEGESGQRREVQSKSTLESTAKSESEIKSRRGYSAKNISKSVKTGPQTVDSAFCLAWLGGNLRCDDRR